jgi:hypothetical protein
MAATGDHCQVINGLSDLPLRPRSTDLTLLIGTRTQRANMELLRMPSYFQLHWQKNSFRNNLCRNHLVGFVNGLFDYQISNLRNQEILSFKFKYNLVLDVRLHWHCFHCQKGTQGRLHLLVFFLFGFWLCSTDTEMITTT